jgi:type IV pilus assembly protein PilN
MKLSLNLATRLHVDPRLVHLIYALLLGVLTLLLLLNLHYLQTVQSLGEHASADLARLAQQEGPGAKEERETTAADWQRLEQEIALANDILLSEGFRWTALLGRLEKVGTSGVRLRSVQPDHRAGSMRISGQARGTDALGTYLDRLLASPDFTDVYLLEQGVARMRNAQGQDVQAISFALVLKGAF